MSDRPRILVTEKIADAGIEVLRSVGDVDVELEWSADELAERIAQGSWNRLFVAERANLDGRNSSFVVETVDATLEARLAEFDVHPTGPMWGEGESGVEGVVNDLEQHVATRFADAIEFVTAARVEFARRPLRVAVREFEWAWLDADALQLSFALRAGSFATAVIRELLDSGGEVLEDEHA